MHNRQGRGCFANRPSNSAGRFPRRCSTGAATPLKIERFFDTRRIAGFNGRQGVIIPASDVKHLMLRRDVAAAAEEGRFTMYPIDTIDQGLELTGIPAGQPDGDENCPAGTLNHRIAAQLDAFAAKGAQFAQAPSSPGEQR